MFQMRDVITAADDSSRPQDALQAICDGLPTVLNNYPDIPEQQMSNGFPRRTMPVDIPPVQPPEMAEIIPAYQPNTSLSDLTSPAGSCFNYLQFSPSDTRDHDNFPFSTSVNSSDEEKTYTTLSISLSGPQTNTHMANNNLSLYRDQNVLSPPAATVSNNSSSSSAFEWNAGASDASMQSLLSDESGFVKAVMNVAVKMNLQQKIKSKKGNIKPEYRQSVKEKLSPEDERKRQDRRLRNKKAAEKCRNKRRTEQNQLEEKAKVLKEENESLKQECAKLEKQKNTFKDLLKDHELICALMPFSSHQVGDNVLDIHNTCNHVFDMEMVFGRSLPGKNCTFNNHSSLSELQPDIL